MISDWNKLNIEVCGGDINASDDDIANGINEALKYADAYGLTVEEMMADEHHRQKAEYRALEAAFDGFVPESAMLVSY